MSPGPRATTSSSLLPVTAILLAAGIFTFDTITDLEIAVPVFYSAVILISVRFCSKRGVVFVGLACIALTFLSDLLTPQTSGNPAGIINTIISIISIAATTYLGLKIESAEQSMHEARTHLAHIARVTTLGELTASLAHEVNQPITATAVNASASLRWLSSEPPNLDEARAAIERIVKDASRAGAIIAHIRGLSRRAPANKVPCDVNAIILEIKALMASELEKRHTVVRTELHGPLPKVNADRVQLQQVVLNLMMNAMEAMDAVSETRRLLVIESTRNDDGEIIIRVSDSGPGLSNKVDIEKIFTPFHSTKSDGMGLGLTITRSIIESHGGRIWADEHKPVGATFCFTLPPTPVAA